MKHQFQYRIGKYPLHSQEQYDAVPGVTVTDVIKYLENVEPVRWRYDIYATIINEAGEVVKISKHPCMILSQSSPEQIIAQLKLLLQASDLSIFNRDNFSCWDYLVINSEDLTEEIIQDAIVELDKENLQ